MCCDEMGSFLSVLVFTQRLCYDNYTTQWINYVTSEYLTLDQLKNYLYNSIRDNNTQRIPLPRHTISRIVLMGTKLDQDPCSDFFSGRYNQGNLCNPEKNKPRNDK